MAVRVSRGHGDEHETSPRQQEKQWWKLGWSLSDEQWWRTRPATAKAAAGGASISGVHVRRGMRRRERGGASESRRVGVLT
jgi:hypothetical protein